MAVCMSGIIACASENANRARKRIEQRKKEDSLAGIYICPECMEDMSEFHYENYGMCLGCYVLKAKD